MTCEANWQRHSFYNRLGERIDSLSWAKYYDSPEYFRVARSRIGDTEIVTEWTGIGEDDCIFQTMVRKNNQLLNMMAAKNEEDAVRNHTLMRENVYMRHKLDKKVTKEL